MWHKNPNTISQNQAPKGKWTVLMTSKGRATTVVATLKVEYNFGY